MYRKAVCTVVLDPHLYPMRQLKLRVYYDGERRYYPLPCEQKFSFEEYKKMKANVRNAIRDCEPYLDIASEICREMNEPFNWKEFEKQYQRRIKTEKPPVAKDSLESLLQMYCEENPLTERTRKMYLTAVNWVDRYMPNAKVCDMDKAAVTGLREFIRKKCNNGAGSENTIRIYMRALRALLNFAVKKEIIPRCPIVPDRRQPLGSIPRQKFALTRAELTALQDCVPKDAFEEFGKDLFFASLQMSGANVCDILQLRNRNIKGNVLEFVRTKTRKSGIITCVPLTTSLLDFLKKYGVVDSSRPDEYILPYLAGGNISENGMLSRIHSAIAKANRGLKSISERLGLRHITTYNARHTFAVYASANGLAVQDIQKFMGHSSAKTTQIYLSSITDGIIERNRTFLESL